MGMETATRHKRGGLYFEDLVPNELVEHRYTRTVTQMDNMLFSQHDAEPAAAPYRPAFLRAGDRMGPAPDELAIHARADDRHPGLRHDGRHHHRQSGHDRREISASAVRGGHRALHHRSDRQARIEIAARRRHRRIFIIAPITRITSWSPMPPAGFYPHAAEVNRALPLCARAVCSGRRAKKLDKAMTSGADVIIVDLEDSIAPDGKARARDSAAAFSKNCNDERGAAVHDGARQWPADWADRRRSRCDRSGKPDAIMLPKAEGGASVIHADAKLAVREAQCGLPDGAIKILPICHRDCRRLVRSPAPLPAPARV